MSKLNPGRVGTRQPIDETGAYRSLAIDVMQTAIDDFRIGNRVTRVSARNFLKQNRHVIWCEMTDLDPDVVREKVFKQGRRLWQQR